jgi:RHS repeat-associated protein
MTYDSFDRCVKIVETSAGSVTSTKQFVWYGNSRCEERDATGALTRQFFPRGEKVGATAYFLTKDHLGSVREMTDSSAVIQAQYAYSPWGEVTVLVNTAPADFGFARMYAHSRSGLNLTKYRAYNAGLGRWLSRDPLGETVSPNLFVYGGRRNNPASFVDPLGLDGGVIASGGPFTTGWRSTSDSHPLSDFFHNQWDPERNYASPGIDWQPWVPQFLKKPIKDLMKDDDEEVPQPQPQRQPPPDENTPERGRTGPPPETGELPPRSRPNDGNSDDDAPQGPACKAG